MKAVLLLVTVITLSSGVFANGLDLEYVRLQYEKAAADKNVCKTMMELLSKHTECHVHLAYLGAYQAIWANHTPGVLSKLNSFNRGRRNIEKAVSEKANSIEIRMIRLSVQKNCPSFLGYNNDIIQDQQYLERNKHSVSSVILRKMIDSLLSK